MKLAKLAFLVTLTMLALVFSATAQTLRSEKDPRNIAPTVGTGGPVGGPTGLFTVYDGQTLRRGEWTLSVAYSNFDRDPGNVDITEVPLSFQIGLNDYLELFFNVDGYRGVKVNSPRNLSGFYLPNSQFLINGALRSAPAIIYAPQGAGTSQYPGAAIFRPTGTQPFVQFPYIGGSTGNFQFSTPSGPIFGFPAGSIPTIGTPSGGGAAANFPGLGSVYGGILPGLVLQTTFIGTSPTAPQTAEIPTVFTLAPSYLPDAPLINRTYGTSSFSTFTFGGKWRWTGPNNPVGVGVVAYYKWYGDVGGVPFTSNGVDFSGFNQLQRGSSPGGSRGDVGAVLFADARVRKWMNISANLGYNYTSSIKADIGGNDDVTLLDRPDEVIAAIGLDFPVNKFFQPILEFRSLQYVGGRTPNAFENSPLDGLAGARIYPFRWMSIGAAYRYHFNQQDNDSFDEDFTGVVSVAGRVPTTTSTTFRGVPPGFATSNDPHGFLFQVTAGRRNERQGDIPRPLANVTALTLSTREIVVPCPTGQQPVAGENCPDGTTISVGTTVENPDNSVLTYQHTVSGGRIVGSGQNVTWDLSGVQPGTYTITSAVDNGCGFCGKTVTETITVRACRCETPCVCPTVSVSGGGNVDAGTPLTFTANVAGGSTADVTYSWTVSAGTITSGQGTPSITVDTTGLAGGTSVRADVTLGGFPPACGCTPTNGETGIINQPPTFTELTPIGAVPADQVRQRLDQFFTELANNPNAQGYIINYGTDRQITQRENLIRNHIRFRNQDPARFTIVRGGDNGQGVNTRLFIVPQGAANPQP